MPCSLPVRSVIQLVTRSARGGPAHSWSARGGPARSQLAVSQPGVGQPSADQPSVPILSLLSLWLQSDLNVLAQDPHSPSSSVHPNWNPDQTGHCQIKL